jgi:hypothetical protein
MSFYTGTQAEVLFSNPSAYPAAGASSTSAALILTGASGAYQQPLFPGGFWQQGRQNQVIHGLISGTISGQASATTATVTLGLATSNNTASSETLGAFPALTITSFSSGPFWIEFVVQARNVGYGTSATATSLETSGCFFATGNSTSVFSLLAPTNINTVDFSVNQWFAPTVTMSTSNAGNTMTVQSVVIWGDN